MTDLTKVLGTVAPWIGTALGGPLGGMAVQAVAGALGLSDQTAESIKSALSGATQEQLLAIKQADNDFAVQMQQLGFKQIADLEALAVDDRKSARDMQASQRSRIPAALSIMVTAGYFGILAGVMTGQLKLDDSQALLLMLGSLSTAWGGVMAFWFGTTADSGRKTDIIARAQPVK